MNNAYFIKLKFWGEVMRKLGVAFGLLLSFNAFAEYGVNMTEGVTSVSHDIYGLHMMVFWVSVAIAIVGNEANTLFGVIILPFPLMTCDFNAHLSFGCVFQINQYF
jgi:hypothetical protein